MFHNREDKEAVFLSKARLYWFSLAFIAGSINVGGFMAAQRFVSHVTGFYTLFGMHAALKDQESSLAYLTVPLFFILGSTLSAILVDRRLQNREPLFSVVFFVSSLVLCLVAALGDANFFGIFGSEANLKHDYYLLSMLCFAAGMQNAVITSASGSAVRISHMTGVSTDLAVGLVRYFTAKEEQQNSIVRTESRRLRLRVGLIIFFTLGGFLGGLAFVKMKYLGFLIPGILSMLVVFAAQKWPPFSQQKF